MKLTPKSTTNVAASPTTCCLSFLREMPNKHLQSPVTAAAFQNTWANPTAKYEFPWGNISENIHPKEQIRGKIVENNDSDAAEGRSAGKDPKATWSYVSGYGTSWHQKISRSNYLMKELMAEMVSSDSSTKSRQSVFMSSYLDAF